MSTPHVHFTGPNMATAQIANTARAATRPASEYTANLTSRSPGALTSQKAHPNCQTERNVSTTDGTAKRWFAVNAAPNGTVAVVTKNIAREHL